VGVFDWIGRRRRGHAADAPRATWQVRVEGSELVVEDSRGAAHRASLSGVRNVRVVPLTGGDHHARAGPGWQVALGRADGDILLGKPTSDWQIARDLARLVCDSAGLPLDELTEKLFSRVGQYTPARDS
jgi:hypothetical protein